MYTYNVAGKYTPLETSRWHISQKFIPTKEKNTCLYIPQRPFWTCTKIYTHMHSDWKELSSRWRIEEAYFCATASPVPPGHRWTHRKTRSFCRKHQFAPPPGISGGLERQGPAMRSNIQSLQITLQIGLWRASRLRELLLFIFKIRGITCRCHRTDFLMTSYTNKCFKIYIYNIYLFIFEKHEI